MSLTGETKHIFTLEKVYSTVVLDENKILLLPHLKIWDFEKKTLEPFPCDFKNEISHITPIPYTDQVLIGFQNGTITLFNWKLSTSILHFKGHDKMITDIKILTRNRFISSSEDKVVGIWNMSSRELLPLRDHIYPITSITITRYGRICSQSKGELKIWELNKELDTWERVLSFDINPVLGFHHLILPRLDKIIIRFEKSIKILDLTTKEYGISIDRNPCTIIKMLDMDEGLVLLNYWSSSEIEIWDVNKGVLLGKIEDIETDVLQAKQLSRNRVVIWSRHSFKLWNLETLKCELVLDKHVFSSGYISYPDILLNLSDGKLLVGYRNGDFVVYS
jgi:WD40 repeat protein